MSLKLQTYRGEKLVKILYDKLSFVMALVFILFYSLKSVDFIAFLSSKDIIVLIFVFCVLYGISFYNYYLFIKRADRKDLWIITGEVKLLQLEIVLNNEVYDINQISKMEVTINGYKRKVKSSRADFYIDGAKNKLSINYKGNKIKTNFFLENISQKDKLEKILEIYKQKTTVIVKS